jgi:DNA-directed RNA polymerase subunit E'/Rpb7
MAVRTIKKPKSARDMRIEREVAAMGPQRKIYGVYMKSLLDTKIVLPITEIGSNIKPNLETKIVSKFAGKCVSEGYVKPGSITIVSYSSGSIMGDQIEFHVVFQCMVCLPVEGMLVECTCKTITKAGIHAQVVDEAGNMPITVFVARDHHHIDDRFNSVKENSTILARVIGVRYELNDPYICSIAKLLEITDKGPAKNQDKGANHLRGGGNLVEPNFDARENIRMEFVSNDDDADEE